jgi:nucleoside-diphosphate-sugar epimerase
MNISYDGMLKNRKILVTGATGFLGGHLISSLVEAGAQITAIDIAEPNQQLSKLCGDRIKWVQADITADNLSGYLSTIDTVYHLAGKSLAGSSEQIFKELCRLNVDGTRNVLTASAAAGVRRFIHISSAAVCGSSSDKVITEKDISPVTSYGLSKLKSEEVVKEICGDKMTYVIFSPTAFFGENHLGSLYEMTKAIKQKRYIMIGKGLNRMNFLYVKDLVDVLIKAADEPKAANQTYIAADTPITLRDFTNLTRKELDQPPVKFYMPRLIGLVLGFGFDIVAKLLHRPMPLSVKRVLNMTYDACYSGAKLTEHLSIKLPYGIYQGWIRTIKWYKSEGLL